MPISAEISAASKYRASASSSRPAHSSLVHRPARMTRSAPSAPCRRWTASARRNIARRPWSSHRSSAANWARMVAGIPAGVGWSLALNASTAARSSGTASGYPTAIRVAKPSSSRSVAVAIQARVPRCPQRGAGHVHGSRADSVLAGDQRRLQRLEEHRADQGRVGTDQRRRRCPAGGWGRPCAARRTRRSRPAGAAPPRAVPLPPAGAPPGPAWPRRGHRPPRRDAPGPRRGAARPGPAGPGSARPRGPGTWPARRSRRAVPRARPSARGQPRHPRRAPRWPRRGATPPRPGGRPARRCSPGPRVPGAGHPTVLPRRPPSG